MQGTSRPVIGYPIQNVNGCAPPPPATSSTAYPYVNPSPYPYYPAPPSQNPRPTFFRRLFVAFAVLLIIFGTILLIFWLRLNGTWNARFQVSNPSKKLSIYYGDIVSSVLHKDDFLTETRIEPFVQGTREVNTVEASYSVVDSFVEGKVVDEMNVERTRGEIRFNIKVLADVAFRYGGWRGRRRLLRVWCDDLAFSGSPGKMTGSSKKCSVD
ncbi:Detected protein of unknown function [Hibiscus syriacus]|uniref:Late embryogenesis abundant protein LEA-2 subgroup domain-containing protein n=1 Tax=Hibiscus syriacus TaxID=106335 RepID=A0A6A3CUT4_HIBSY|nr:Detected protein of unknown function [Hibiscus syriacus]